ncbi:MAG TPA: hormogonium polysaccharide secretion pseudopilin HpsB [Leptolyngbyaceae cyanobacterium]
MIGKQVNKKRLHTNKITKTIASYWQSKNQGFTIIESLVGILVVGILLVAIAPVLSLSVATRVQARRVEIASQAARSYIDGVRTKTIDPPAAITTDISGFNAPSPTGNINCNTNSYCTPTSTSTTPTNLYCMDFDGLPVSTSSPPQCQSNSAVDMVIQVFRYNKTSGSTASNGYALGIRVYRADAFRSGATLRRNTSTATATQNPYTPGGGGRTAPLLEMTSEISDTVPKYSDLCDRLRRTADDCK